MGIFGTEGWLSLCSRHVSAIVWPWLAVTDGICVLLSNNLRLKHFVLLMTPLWFVTKKISWPRQTIFRCLKKKKKWPGNVPLLLSHQFNLSTSQKMTTFFISNVLQLHIVHMKHQYTDLATALQDKDGVAVLGFFYEVTALSHNHKVIIEEKST